MEEMKSRCAAVCSCTTAALVASAIVGVLTAFLQITGMITLTPAFLWVALGVGVVYLGVLIVAASLAGRRHESDCLCSRLNVLLAGILGTVFFAVLLLALGVVATSVISAILAGLLLFFSALTLTGSACYVRCLSGCSG